MRSIADTLLADLARRLGPASRPRVRDLHLPPAPWNGSKDGEFGALELDDGSLGLSYVLLDDTLDAVLANCRNARRIALIGPGAGCLPATLFERGVTTLGGSWITDPRGFKQALQHGAPWSAFARKFMLQAGGGPRALER